MYFFLLFILFALNMIFFGILNIPLFKYFCDLPIFDNSETLNGYLFFKSYFLIDVENEYFYSYFFSLNNYIHFFSFSMEVKNIFFTIYFFFVESLFNFLFSSYDYIEVVFQTSVSNYNFVEFSTLQKFIYVMPNETHLIFFRMYNSVGFDVTGISIYLLYPTDYLLFFNKIQCFCFEELYLYPYESIDLPVVFFISDDLLNYLDFFYSNKLYLSYLFLIR